MSNKIKLEILILESPNGQYHSDEIDDKFINKENEIELKYYDIYAVKDFRYNVGQWCIHPVLGIGKLSHNRECDNSEFFHYKNQGFDCMVKLKDVKNELKGIYGTTDERYSGQIKMNKQEAYSILKKSLKSVVMFRVKDGSLKIYTAREQFSHEELHTLIYTQHGKNILNIFMREIDKSKYPEMKNQYKSLADWIDQNI